MLFRCIQTNYPNYGQSDWESQQQIREELKDRSGELKRYENKLHQLTFNDNKAECFGKRGNKDKSIKFRNLSEGCHRDVLDSCYY